MVKSHDKKKKKKSKETSNDPLTMSPKNIFHCLALSQGGSKTRLKQPTEAFYKKSCS